MEDRRKNKRLELSGDIVIKEITSGPKADTVEIEIIDASTEGIGFTTDKQLMIGANYEANLTLWTKETVHVFVQIVRAWKEGDTYCYGGMFIGMPEDVKMHIGVYGTVEDALSEQQDNT